MRAARVRLLAHLDEVRHGRVDERRRGDDRRDAPAVPANGQQQEEREDGIAQPGEVVSDRVRDQERGSAREPHPHSSSAIGRVARSR